VSRRRKEYEAEDIAAMLTRMTKALVRRAAEGDTFALVALRQARDDITDAMSDAARALHGDPFNYPWSLIGADLGITRQAAQQMAGRHREEQAS
jgi:hypothetical protein